MDAGEAFSFTQITEDKLDLLIDSILRYCEPVEREGEGGGHALASIIAFLTVPHGAYTRN